MAFTVQNDAGTEAGANALVSVAEFNAYHADRGTDVTTYTDQAKQGAIVKATDYMAGRWTFVGAEIGETCWPRSGAVSTVSGEAVEGIPAAVKKACHEYALLSLLGTPLWKDPAANADGRIVQAESVSAGPVSKSTTYAVPGTRPKAPSYPIADRHLAISGLLAFTGGLVRA